MIALDIARLLVDFGLFLVIWMVQLIIYPSFVYYTDHDAFMTWHSRYSRLISYFVVPLMIGQVVLTAWSAIWYHDILKWTNMILIAYTWWITFTQAVPMHNQLATHCDAKACKNSLIEVNWSRTISWTLIFVLTIVEIFILV